MPTLFIRLKSPASRHEDGYRLQCEWLIEESDGSVRASGTTDYQGLSDLIDPSADWLQNPDNLVVIVPTEHVLAVSCDVPGRSIGQIRRALPFVVEEFVATDIDGMHLAHAAIRRGHPTRVQLIARSFVEDWLTCLRELGLNPGYLVADAELLPTEAGTASVLLDHQTALIRTKDQAASVDRENLILAVSALEVERLHFVHGTPTDLERGQLDPELEVQLPDEHYAAALTYFAASWRKGAERLNLLQGPFTPVRPASASFGRWRAVASLAGIWVLVGFISMIAQGFWAGSRASALEASSEDLYRELFPAEQRIVNVRRQMQQKLGQSAGGSAGFTTFLGWLAQGVDRTTGVLSLTYTDARDELAADLLLGNYDELEKLKQKLAQMDVRVEITSAEQQSGGVRARIRLLGGQGT